VALKPSNGSEGSRRSVHQRGRERRDGMAGSGRPGLRRATSPCPNPGPNGNHYFVEVDPGTGSPAPFSGFLRCRWCGESFRAYEPFPDPAGESRTIRTVELSDVFRAVEEAL